MFEEITEFNSLTELHLVDTMLDDILAGEPKDEDIRKVEIPDRGRGFVFFPSHLKTYLTFEILSYVAEKEREEIKRRQREGIESARAKGVKFGRTKIPKPEKFDEIYQKVLRREITNRQAMSELGLKTNTYYSFVKECTKESSL